MTAQTCEVAYGTHVIGYTLIRRDRRTLEISVEPDMSVVVVAPLDAPEEAIAARIRKRAAWVRRQQRYFSQFLPRTPERRYVAGETHRYLGRQYRLKLVGGEAGKVTLQRGFITVVSKAPENPQVTQTLVTGWYRERARITFRARLAHTLARFPNPGDFTPKGLIVRRLRQRWGSMSPGGRLLLNSRLIEAPVDAIDYVITHELCHIAEPHHGPGFFDLLTRIMPDWQKRKDQLERVLA